eukprot:TRINITY_DN7791_c1_g1_i1.p1 TRINITY_DN7791_c1_g1~~TRINITY_DN7791_c1_g1_i1.p1  ORF type:complete len:116 (+),score=9.48 TRINITY_DN7791_c1_g1_i1:305-652(+)
MRKLKTNLPLDIGNVEEVAQKVAYEMAVGTCYKIGVGYGPYPGYFTGERVLNINSFRKCQDLCKDREGCIRWTWQNSLKQYLNSCFLQDGSHGYSQLNSCNECVSGPKTCAENIN